MATNARLVAADLVSKLDTLPKDSLLNREDYVTNVLTEWQHEIVSEAADVMFNRAMQSHFGKPQS